MDIILTIFTNHPLYIILIFETNFNKEWWFFMGLDSSIYNGLYVWKHIYDMMIWNEASIHDKFCNMMIDFHFKNFDVLKGFF
jgi:hypothetical protein